MRRSLLLMLSLIFLTSCAPSRGAADSKLAMACQAAVKSLFKEPDKEKITVKNATFKFDKAYDGSKLRVVTLEAGYIYNNSEPDNRTYSCTFTEEWSFFSWLPEFYWLEKDAEKFGNVNGVVTGDADTIAKITDAVDKALH